MAADFAEKFEKALDEARERDRGFSLRELARRIAQGDPRRTEVVRRQLYKYRPKKPGGIGAVAPTEPTRHEIEKALGLERDALAPDADAPIAAEGDFLAQLEARVDRLEWEALSR